MTDDLKQSWNIARGILIAVAVLATIAMLATLHVLLPVAIFAGFSWAFGKAMNFILPKVED